MEEMIAKTRAEAEEWELVTYKTGKACCRGHMGKRFASTGACVECLKEGREEYKKGLGWRDMTGDGKGEGRDKMSAEQVRGWEAAAGRLEGVMKGWRVGGRIDHIGEGAR